MLVEAFENRGGRVVTAPASSDAGSLLEHYQAGARIEELERATNNGRYQPWRGWPAERGTERQAGRT